ncbi:replication protein A [Chloropicon primus]|uniref:Replication protein A n=1 Tax=Chloropicon primus TaxID=1764295 RepID=A0A5B8MAQ8_9CHLO|nr:replication protein A [Chloropicon primus]|eukprot:QDZ17528.1 replication protein A [Chloropicon primus]
MSQGTGMVGGRRVQPIQSLNPYMGATWTIRARVANKSNMRTYKSAKGDGNLFNVEFIDEEGTRIEATLWREVAQKYFENIEEGKVYYISKAGLKPANKAFSSVQNDYQLLISDRTEIEECNDASAEQLQKVKPKLNVTKIGDLPRHLGSRMLLDIIGVVASVSPLGSVKRKVDQSELARRDLTIFDTSGRQVTVTMWQTLASEEGDKLDKMQTVRSDPSAPPWLDSSCRSHANANANAHTHTHTLFSVFLSFLAEQEYPIIALQGVRANDYNGVSLSTVSRSTVIINPSTDESSDDFIPEAKELKEWLSQQGGKIEYPHCGAGLANNGRTSLGGAANNTRVTLQDLREKPVPAVGTKPEYVNTWAYVSNIQPDQTLYYMAAPDGSNKKVVAEGDRYYSEGTGKHYDSFIRRYVMRCEVMDHTGNLTFNVFNDQAEVILGCKADEIAESKESKDAAYDVTLKNALLVPYTFRVACKPEEYNNQTRLRFAAQSLKPLNFVEQSTYLIGQIDNLLPKAEAAH